MKRTVAVCLFLVMILTGCGTRSPEATPVNAEMAALGWSGEGACYALTILPETELSGLYGCVCYDGQDVYAVNYIRLGLSPMKLTKNDETLFELKFSLTYAMQRAGERYWVVGVNSEDIEARLYSAEGEILVSVPLEQPPLDSLTDGEDLWLDYGGTVIHITPDGGSENIVPEQDYDRLVVSGDGEVFICTRASGGQVLPLSGGRGFDAKGIVGSGLGDTFLYEARPDGIYELSAKGEARLFISYEECMIKMGKLFSFEPMGEGYFYCERPMGDMMLRPADPSEIGAKEPIYIAVFDTYSELNEYIARFNAVNTQYEIITTNYCEGGQSLEQGQMRMNTELAAGDGPDMIAFTDSSKRANNRKSITVPAYISRGWLEDLTPYIENDALLNKENIPIYDALSSLGGVYVLADSFIITGLRGTRERFGDMTGWTIDEYLAMEASLEEEQTMIYPMDEHVFVERVGGQYVKDTIDWTTGTVEFDPSVFAQILEAAKRVKINEMEQFLDPETFQTSWQMMGKDTLILSSCTVSMPDDCAFDIKYTGKDIVYFGYPSVDGKSVLTAELNNPIGIVTTSEHKDACWEFIKYMVLNKRVGLHEIGLPVYYPLIEEWAQILLDNEITDTVYTEDDLEPFYDVLERPESIDIYDDTVMDIMFEEAEGYFAGNRTAEDAAARVQERVSLYVAEQS